MQRGCYLPSAAEVFRVACTKMSTVRVSTPLEQDTSKEEPFTGVRLKVFQSLLAEHVS